MIQPSVVETDADQIAVNEEEKQRTILGREAVEAANGSRRTELPHRRARRPAAGRRKSTHDRDDRSSAYNSKTGATTKTTDDHDDRRPPIPTTV